MFTMFDRDKNGSLDRHELRELMTELNGGISVGDDAVDFVVMRVEEARSEGDEDATRTRSLLADATDGSIPAAKPHPTASTECKVDFAGDGPLGIGLQPGSGDASGEIALVQIEPGTPADKAGVTIPSYLVALQTTNEGLRSVGHRRRGMTHEDVVTVLKQVRRDASQVSLTFDAVLLSTNHDSTQSAPETAAVCDAAIDRCVVFEGDASYGIGLKPEDSTTGEVSVVTINPGSQAAAAGIPVPSYLVAIEAADGVRRTIGRTERGMSHAQAVKQLRVASRPVKLTFRYTELRDVDLHASAALPPSTSSQLLHCRVSRDELRPAIAMWRFLQHETGYLDVAVDRWADATIVVRGHENRATGADITKLLQELNEGNLPSSAEVEWVLTKTNAVLEVSSGKDGGTDDDAHMVHTSFTFDLRDLKAAVALWYPHVYNRRDHGELRRLPSSRANVGRFRRAVAAEIGMHKFVMTKALRKWASHHDGHIHHDEIPRIMMQINNGVPASPENVHFVMACGDQHGLHSNIDIEEVTEALAVWRCITEREDEINRHFDRFDTNKSGVLERSQVKNLLQELNEGIPVSWQETDWAIEAADVDGSDSLSHTELHAAIAWWYINVDKAHIDPTTGLRATTPWIYSFVVALMAVVLVRTISSGWSHERTWTWAQSSLLGVLFKLCVLDPIKVMCCCEALVGPLFAWLTGELSFDGDFDMDALVEVVEDGLEARIEAYTGSSGNELHGAWDDVAAARQAGALQSNQAVFAVGGLGAAKFSRKIEQSRNRREMRRQLDVDEQETSRLEATQQSSMARSTSRYAEKVRKKREAAGKKGGGALDKRARQAAEKAEEMHHKAHARDIAAVSTFLQQTKDGRSTVHAEDQLWKQAIDENRTHMSKLELQRKSSSSALQAKLDAKKKARRDREIRTSAIRTFQGIGALQTFSRPLPRPPRGNPRRNGAARTRGRVRGKEDELGAAQPAPAPAPAPAPFGLSAVTSAKIELPTFDVDEIDEAELDMIIAAAAQSSAGSGQAVGSSLGGGGGGGGRLPRGSLDEAELDAILDGAGGLDADQAADFARQRRSRARTPPRRK